MSPYVHENEYGEPLPPLADAVNVKTVVASPLVGDTFAVTLMSEVVTDPQEDVGDGARRLVASRRPERVGDRRTRPDAPVAEGPRIDVRRSAAGRAARERDALVDIRGGTVRADMGTHCVGRCDPGARRGRLDDQGPGCERWPGSDSRPRWHEGEDEQQHECHNAPGPRKGCHRHDP